MVNLYSESPIEWDNQESIVLRIDFTNLKNRIRGNLYVNGYCKSMMKHIFNRMNLSKSVNIFYSCVEESVYGDILAKILIIIQPKN